MSCLIRHGKQMTQSLLWLCVVLVARHGVVYGFMHPFINTFRPAGAVLMASTADDDGSVSVLDTFSLGASARSIGLLCDKINSYMASPFDDVAYTAEEWKSRQGSSKKSLELRILKARRYYLLAELLRKNRVEYLEVVKFYSNTIPRNEIPNVQDLPMFASNSNSNSKSSLIRKDINNPSIADAYEIELLSNAETEKKKKNAAVMIIGVPLVDSCTLTNATYSENLFDKTALKLFRSQVQKETGYISPSSGIEGLLDEGRSYMLTDEGTAENQHNMVKNVLRALMTPFLPPFYRIFMAGVVPCTENGDPQWLIDLFASIRSIVPGTNDEKEGEPGGDVFLAPGSRLFGGPLFYAPFLTSFILPPLVNFLLGPSHINYRKDGQLGGLVVEKCKFLQLSGCKGICLNECKVPAQEFFSETLKLDLNVEPNFATQECQWSWGETPLPHTEDPAWPNGCLTDCPTRSLIKPASS
jgi:hypothetical protein